MTVRIAALAAAFLFSLRAVAQAPADVSPLYVVT